MARPYLIVLVLSLLLAVCDAARRKPQDLACATDLYAKAVVPVKNINRKLRGLPLLTCTTDNELAWRL